VQEALISRGYDIGAVDGIAGSATNAGLEYYKRDHGFYGEGLTYQVLESLGVDPKTSGPAFASL
jgi:peptidoglycan hydrolase-like protein with peptidoglycan-binding domain